LRKHPVEILEEQVSTSITEVDFEFINLSNSEGSLPANSTEIPILIEKLEE
jgi:hypothetical protein